MDYKIDPNSIEVEELDSSAIPQSELKDFQETQPIFLSEIIEPVAGPSSDTCIENAEILRTKILSPEAEDEEILLTKFVSGEAEDEEVLLTKFVNGEAAFPDYYTTMDGADDEDEMQNIEKRNKASFDEEFNNFRRDALKGNLKGSHSKDKRYVRKSILKASLQGLMGEANLCFARGKNKLAENICLEIIRQNPLAPEPFLTLAQIYESTDDNKFLQFSTIAAHLERTNRDQWIRVAEMNLERNNTVQARIAYTKAIKYLPKDVDLRMRKAQLLESINDERSVMCCYYHMLSILPPGMGELALSKAKKVAIYFHKNKKYMPALNAMKCAYNLASKLFSTEDINLFLELLMMNESYLQVLITLRESANLDVVYEEQDDNNISVVACVIPDAMLPDFRIKLCVTLIHLKASHLYGYLINNILEFIEPMEAADWYVDVAEALMKEEHYSDALDLLVPFVERTDITAPAYVWLRVADCQRALNKVDMAIMSYYKVVELAPNCFDARLTLSAHLKLKSRYNDAIQVLEQDMENDQINPVLLYEQCLMLKEMGDLVKYLEVGYYVLLRTSIKLRSADEMLMSFSGRDALRSVSAIRALRESRMESPHDDGPEYIVTDNNLSADDEYKLFKDLITTAIDLKMFGTVQKLVLTAKNSSIHRQNTKEIERMAIFAFLYNNNPHFAFSVLREEILKDVHNKALWNIYNMIIQYGDDVRYRRFNTRVFSRFHGYCDPDIYILGANYYLSSNSFKYALNDYIPIFEKTNDPLLALLIGVCFSQIASQKNVTKKPTIITHAIAFVRKYSDLRMSPVTKQEVLYNLGRMHHHTGLIHLAIYYYEEALKVPLNHMQKEHDMLDLTQQIAFNLHVIYKANGNLEMARKYLFEYITI